MKLATAVWEKLPALLSAATINTDQQKEELKLWTKVLVHKDNLDAVGVCGPLCLMYNDGICSALQAAAANGKTFAMPHLEQVYK